MAKRILLMYITLNSGHHRASCAIENSVRQLSPSADVVNINAFRYTNPILEKVINKTYMSVLKNKPEVWDYLYDNPKVLKNVQGMRDAIHRYNSKKLNALLEDFKPDVCVCTQAFPCGMVADYKKNANARLPLIGVLTDHAPHSYWIFDSVDYYITPSEECKCRFVKNGVDASKIKVFGIPIDPRFRLSHDRSILRKKLGFLHTLPVVLIMGGSQGMGPVESIIDVLTKVENDFQLAVICGLNRRLYRKLTKIAPKLRKRLVVFGHVVNVDEIMEISSIIITKPGGLTTSEALSKDLPMVIAHPLPGQEEKNTEYLLNRGVGVRAEDNEDIRALIQELLSNEIKLNEMKKRANEIKKPEAAIDIARLILAL